MPLSSLHSKVEFASLEENSKLAEVLLVRHQDAVYGGLRRRGVYGPGVAGRGSVGVARRVGSPNRESVRTL